MYLHTPSQIGFHVRLLNDATWTAENVLPDDFHRIYTEGGFTFFKDDITRGLDEMIGDVDSHIKDNEGT
jgi:hypothetical protein